MEKFKIKQFLSKVMCSTAAAAMTLTSFSGFVNVAAADATLTHDNAVSVKAPTYEDTQSYVAGRANQKIVTDVKNKSEKQILKDLTQTEFNIRLKRLIGEKSKMPKDCTIDQLWKKHPDAFISQYTDILPLYQTSRDAQYYIVDFSAVNGLGEMYDVAFVRGKNNKNPDVRTDMKFDKKTGLAYIPKAYFEKDPDVLLTGQVLYAGSIKNQDTKIDVTVKNPNKSAKEKHQILTANTYDVTVKIPVTDSLKVARGLKLEDFEVYLNDSEIAYDLKANEAAIYDENAGELEIAVSPASLKSIRVEIKKDKLSQKILKLFTTDVSAKITNPDKLKFVTDKKTGKPIVFDRIDTSKLQDGQVFEYKSAVRYFSDLSETTVDYNSRAAAEAIKHSIKSMYIPTGSANSGWFDIYDKGSEFEDTNGVNLKSNWEDVTFGMTMPNYDNSKYKATALNKNQATLNFHQKGSFVTAYDGDDASYSSKHMYAGECCHITNPMGTFQDGNDGKLRLSILHVDTEDGYVIIGLNSQEINTQSGFGIYKVAIESKGHLKVKKTSANPTITNGNSCYSLDGAQFGVYKDAGCTEKVLTLTTDAKGETSVAEVDAGTYYVKETKAPKGYEMDRSVHAVKVSTDNDEEDPALVSVTDQPKNDPINFEVKKVDKETGKTVQGDANLSGAQFTVKYYAGYYDNESQLPVNATRTWILETRKRGNNYEVAFDDSYKVSGDDFYKDPDGMPVVPYGTITIEETKAPDGYKIEDSTVSVNGSTLKNRKYFTKISDNPNEQPSKVITDFTVSDPSKKYGIQVWKSDQELDQSEAIGGKDHVASADGTTLANVKFSIVNRSASSVHYQGKDIAPGEEVLKISTKWEEDQKRYVAQTEQRALPYGTYGVKEISSGQGYLLTDGSEKGIVCHGEDGKMYSPEDQINLNFKNQVIRGDYEFLKKALTSQKSLSAAFKVTNTTSGEQHVVVTDRNGEFDSSANPHSKDTNKNDKLLEHYNKEEGVKASNFDYDAGIWFGQGENGSMAKADDSKGAFPYGKYEVEELRSDTNKGMKLVKYDFYVTKDGKKVNGGTINDEDEAVPKIQTSAKDEATGTHVSSATEDVSIIDTVTYENLEPEKEHTLVGVLMDPDTRAPILIDGKEVRVEKTFTPKTKNGTVDVEFHLDATSLAGKTTVVFEDLTLNGDVIATHRDFTDENQTIRFPDLKTEAIDAESGSHTVEASEEMKIVDKISYTNLIPGKTYEFEGILMDKKTGKPVLDDNGQEITAKTKAKVETADGVVEVVFTFSGVKTAGKTIVAFETVKYQGKEYAVHADLNDENQTVYVPKVRTTAVDQKTQTHVAKAEKEMTIVDTVSCENLIIGKEYTVRGVLMNQKSGETLLVNGAAVTASKTFTAKSVNETVDLLFTFDGSSLGGTQVVVFEDLYEGDVKVGSHADLTDKNQTVTIPKIGTTATDQVDGDHEAEASQKVIIVDKIQYEGVEAGKEIKFEGVLMNQTTKKPILVNGAEVTGTAFLVPEKSFGSAEVKFVFDGRKLGGVSAVAFETAYDVATGAVIAEHKDIHDQGQTVRIVKSKTPDIKKTSTPSSGNSTTRTSSSVKTGQLSILPEIIGGLLLAGSAIAIILWKRKIKK